MKERDAQALFSVYRESAEGRIINTHANEDAMELVEVTSGRVRVQIGTDFSEAERGDFLFVPRGRVFRAEALGGAASVRGVVFDASLIEDNMQNFDAEVFYMFDVQSRNKITVFGVGHSVHPTLLRYMQDTVDEYMTKDVCYRLPICANIYHMMTALLRYYCSERNQPDKMVYHNVLRLRPVVAYIAEHFSEKIYVERLADMINVSPDYFTKMFRDSIGRTPIDYINGLRINYAMRLLSEGDMPMAEIADVIGFCNTNYFHKIFKQYTDTSPLAYRKSCK
ncbi:MAG: helix-turn-helix transcriptional regulator [Clostridia bacterium]|nr:helix-turn-helix transcriptional regulator [Clostridia bacterium]